MPHFVWQRGRVGDRKVPGAVSSALHAGYAFSGVALAAGAALWVADRSAASLLFGLAHLTWISAVVSVILLNPSFLEDLEGRPLERLGWANHITMARVLLLPLLLLAVLRREWGFALAGYVLLSLTDVLDGWIARRRHEESKLGFVLDPLGDILFHVGIFLSLATAGALPWWVVALVGARYGCLLLGCALLYGLKGEIWIQPTAFGKATGLLIGVLTGILLLARLAEGVPAGASRWAGRILGVILALGLLHVFVIGWINFRRPLQGGTAVYQRRFGLLLGRRVAGAQQDPRGDEGNSPTRVG